MSEKKASLGLNISEKNLIGMRANGGKLVPNMTAKVGVKPPKVPVARGSAVVTEGSAQADARSGR
jgi:hypothetical protein